MSQPLIPAGTNIGGVNVEKDINSKEELKAFLLKNNLSTADELSNYGGTETERVSPDGSTVDIKQVTDWTLDNLDVVAPAAAGVAASMVSKGAALPIASSAITAAASKYYTDTRKGKEPSVEDALYEGLFSAGIDTATLGLTRIGMPVLRSMGFSKFEAEKLIDASDKKKALPPETEESLLQTQNLLRQDPKGGLSLYQTGKANPFQAILEGITDVGVYSGQASAARHKANTEVIRNGFLDLINTQLSSGKRQLGSKVYQIISTGKKALGDNYENALTHFNKNFGKTQVRTEPIVTALRRFTNEARIVEDGTILASKLLPEAREIIDNEIKILSQLPAISAENIVDLNKMLRSKITEAGDFGTSSYNRPLEAQLTKLSNRYNTAFEAALSRKNPKALEDLKQLNSDYAVGRANLLPPITESVIKSAESKEYYEAIGDFLIGEPSASGVLKVKQSLQQAFKEAKTNKVSLPSDGYQNANEAFEAIKGGYIRGLIPDVNSKAFKIENYRDLARQFNDPSVMEVQQAVLGKDYGAFKGLVNAMSEATEQSDSFLGTLMMNSKNAQATMGIAQGGAALGTGALAGVATGDPLVGIASGLTWVLAPAVLQKIIANKRAVNVLLALEGQSKKGSLTPTFMLSGVAKIMTSLSEEDQEFIRNKIRMDVLGPLKEMDVEEALQKQLPNVSREIRAAQNVGLGL